jgi:hypothetical protein
VKERAVTLLCALGALVLFVTMFMHGDEDGWGGKEVSRPTTEESGWNGYRGAVQWLDLQHVRTVSLRERFDKLMAQPHLAPAGNVLIVTLPAATVFRTEEFRPLDGWVRAGNTLLVVAALSDNPDWAFAQGNMAAGDLNLLTGLDFETVKSRELRLKNATHTVDQTTESGDLASRIAAATRELAHPRFTTLVPNRAHPYFDGVHKVVALSDYISQAWTVKVPYEGFVFALAHQQDTGEGVLWTRPFGSGRIIVSGFGSLFTNRALGLADNGRLFANIISSNLGPNGSVVFDDVHQGLGSVYDPAKFYRDPRLRMTAIILALLWLSWVLGATRLRAPTMRAPVPREAELVRATGAFLARVLAPAAAARRMMAHFRRELGLPMAAGASVEVGPSTAIAGADVCEFLERHTRVAPADVQQLRVLQAQLGTTRRVPLARLHNLLVRINRQLNS